MPRYRQLALERLPLSGTNMLPIVVTSAVFLIGCAPVAGVGILAVRTRLGWSTRHTLTLLIAAAVSMGECRVLEAMNILGPKSIANLQEALVCGLLVGLTPFLILAATLRGLTPRFTRVAVVLLIVVGTLAVVALTPALPEASTQ